MVFYIVVFNDAEGMGSIKVTNQMLNRWKISEETLKTDAQVNTPLLQPAKICTLGHMICKLMGDKNMEQDSEELGFDIREALEESNQIVLTNKSGINGFGAILFDNCLYYIAERYGVEKLHILPSSIHEGIIMPADNMDISPDELQKMVCEVNNTVVLKEELLSNSVYIYDKVTDRIDYAKKGDMSYV